MPRIICVLMLRLKYKNVKCTSTTNIAKTTKKLTPNCRHWPPALVFRKPKSRGVNCVSKYLRTYVIRSATKSAVYSNAGRELAGTSDVEGHHA